MDLPLLKVAAPELVAGVSGESESRIRELFDQAISASPCILFLDEIDAVLPHRATVQREMEKRIVAQLLSCLDGNICIYIYIHTFLTWCVFLRFKFKRKR